LISSYSSRSFWHSNSKHPVHTHTHTHTHTHARARARAPTYMYIRGCIKNLKTVEYLKSKAFLRKMFTAKVNEK